MNIGMTSQEERVLSLTDKVINRKQQLFVRYIIAILIDLTVLNLYNEYFPEHLHIETFSLSLLAAILLQLLLQLTLKFEHLFAQFFFKDKTGVSVKILRALSAWSIIFVSKLIMLKALSIVFENDVHFYGAFHGVIAFILVITTMIVAEQVVLKIHNYLSK